MIIGTAAIPSAPVLVPGMAPTLAAGLEPVDRQVRAALAALPAADVTLVIASAQVAAPTIFQPARVSLAGLGRADLNAPPAVAGPAAAAVAAQAHVRDDGDPGDRLPVDLACLCLHLAGRSLLPLVVPADAPHAALRGLGEDLVGILAAVARVAVVVAGDLAAGHSARAPLHVLDGSAAFDGRVVAEAEQGRLGGLARLGPQEAWRLGARGWAPLAVLSGVAHASHVGLVVRHYSAPQGVGYLVALGG